MSYRFLLAVLIASTSYAVVKAQITAKDWIIYESEDDETRLGPSDISASSLSPSHIEWSKLSAVNRSFNNAGTTEQNIQLPLPDGTTETFVIQKNKVIPAELSDKYPDIRSYTCLLYTSPSPRDS